MAKKKAETAADRMRKIYELQVIDTQIDKIRTLKGELPMEVEDLEDDLAGLTKRVDTIAEGIGEVENELVAREESIKKSNELIKKYEKQMDNVKNSREFDALTKEVGMQKLDIQLAEKKIREAKENLENKKTYLEENKDKITRLEGMLNDKKEELERITKETDKEEKDLLKKSEKERENVDESLLKAYDRIRGAYKDGLAVVSVERNSCGGCHAAIPPQVQIDIDEQKKIISCEHCGRILVPDYAAAKV
ncbi:MAG: C4-type zinc ribbon domain-containing protein [Chitinophagales bacterium]